MRSWYGSTWDSSSPMSNLSASAPPFSVASPSAPSPDLGPNMDSGDPLIFPLNTSLNSRVSPNPTVSVPDWISSPVDPELDTVNYTGENPYSSSYSDFSGVSRSNVNEVRTYYPQYYFPELDPQKPLNFDNHPSYGGLSASRGGTERGSLYNDRTNGFFSLSSPLHVSDVCSEVTNRGWYESTPFCSALNSGTDGSVHRSYKHQGTQSFDGVDASTEASNDVDVLNRGYQAVSTISELVDMNLFPGNNIEVMNDSPPMADSTSVLSQEYSSAPPLDFCVEPRNYQMGYSNLVGNCSGEHFSGQGNGYSVIDNVLSSARPPIAAKISERNVLPDATQHRAGQGEKNIRIGRYRIGNGDYLKNEEVSGDTFDRLSTPVSRVEAPCMVVDGLNLAHESNHACSAFENVSESLNHYGHTVDSPCWKGVSIKRLGSSKACEIVAPNHVSEFKDLNSLNPHISQVSAENFVCELNIFTQKQSELTTQERNMISGKKSARPEEQPEVQHSSAPGVGFGDILEVCPCHLRPSYSCMSQGSEDVYAPWKRHASIDKLAGNVSGKISKVKRNSYVPDVTMKEKQPSLGDGSDLDRKIHDAIDMGLSDVSMRCVEHVLSSPPSTMKASAKHSNIHGEEFTPRMDVPLLIKTMLNLSELLLFHNFSGTSDFKEQDYEVLKMVSNNLEACYLKDVKLVSRSKESSSPVQDGSPFHRESLKHQKNEELKQPVGSSRGIDDQECPAAATNAAENMQSSLGGMLEKDGSNPYSKLSQMRIVEGTQLPNQKEKTDTSCNCEKHSVLLGLPEDDNPNNLTHHGLACFVKQDKITEDIKRILMENFHEEVGLEPQTHLLKNLWLEAEAALCSVNYMSRYNHMKFQMVKSKPVNEKDAYENAKPDLSIPGQRSMDAADDVMDKARERGIYSLNDVEVEHPSTEVADISVLPSSVPHPDHLECSSVLERSSILKQRLDYKNSTKSDDLSPRFMDIPSTPPSDILESSVMADFSILKHRDDVISSSVCNVAAVESLNLESAVKHDFFVEHHISQSQLNGSCLHPAAESPSPLRHSSLEWEHVHREEINILP